MQLDHHHTMLSDHVDSDILISNTLATRSVFTSIVFPLEAVTMSPGLIPVPLIIFSQAAAIKWTYQKRIKSLANTNKR